jgi:hypothetical protein
MSHAGGVRNGCAPMRYYLPMSIAAWGEAVTIEEFLNRLSARELPKHPIGRIQALARELAEGAYAGVWPLEIYAFRGDVAESSVTQYLDQRWNNESPGFALLSVMNYLDWNGNNGYVITKQSFDLIGEAPPADVFISYRRKESSAFALLVLSRLKAAGLNPFLDMSLIPGEAWQQGLKSRIQSNDYLVALIGPGTLASSEVASELLWAVEADVTIIPVWHGGFAFSAGATLLDPEVERILRTTHTIRVLEESAIGYNNAIVELLNRFGVTP